MHINKEQFDNLRALDSLVGQKTYGDRPFYGRILEGFAKRFRRKRFQLFQSIVPAGKDWRILDLGCGSKENAWFVGNPGVVGFDLNWQEKAYPVFVCGQATALPFPDKSFDLVFSNSLIEHLPTWELQRQCANEIRRVSRHYWVQVPNRHFPIDPHYIVPFFQYLPEPIMRWWARHLPLGWHRKNTYFERVNCLTSTQMHSLFPDSRIIREKAGFLTKSFIAVAE